MTDGPSPRSQGGDWKPTPDPTALTTEALHREIAALREAMEAKVVSLKDVLDERFRSIESRLALAEQHRLEQKQDTQNAIDAALASQKDAVREQTITSDRATAKSEAAITRQLEQLGSTFTATIDGIRRSIDDSKERIGAVENRITSVEQQKAGAKEDRSSLYATLGAIGAAIAIAVFFFASRATR